MSSSKIIFKLTYRLVGNVNETRLVIILNHLKSHLVGLEGSGLLAVFKHVYQLYRAKESYLDQFIEGWSSEHVVLSYDSYHKQAQPCTKLDRKKGV